MQRRRIFLGVGLVALVGGWAAFRPERLWIDHQVDETLEGVAISSLAVSTAEAGGPAALAAGSFHSGAHETTGQAAVYELADGRRILRLSGFHTSNGPDVRVYLLAATDAVDDDTVKKTHVIDLGALKGNVGDQNYDVPADVDLATHRAVTIWCRRFGVNFGTAPLTMHRS